MIGILRVFLITAILLGLEVALVYLITGYTIELGTEYSIHHYGFERIFTYSTSFILVFLLFYRKSLRKMRLYKKANFDFSFIALMIFTLLGVQITSRVSFDFTRILDHFNGDPIEPYTYRSKDYWSLFYTIITSVVMAPILEEILFRKLILSELLEKYSLSISLLVTNVLFALIHLPNYRNLIPTFVFGILCSLVVIKTKKIIYPMIIHMLSNCLWLITAYMGEPYFSKILALEFNYIYWLYILIGVGILIYGSRKIWNYEFKN